MAGAFHDHVMRDNVIVVSHPPAAMALERFIANQPPDSRTPVETIEIDASLIYSLLLHFRVLLHFFYGNPRQDDCCVEHFRKLPGFESAFPPSMHAKPNWEPELSKHLHKRLAHFTRARWVENQASMNYYAVHFKEVLELVRAFETALPGESGHHFSAKMIFYPSRYSLTVNKTAAKNLGLTLPSALLSKADRILP